MLEQINLDLSNKIIAEAQEWSEKEFTLSEQLQQATFQRDMTNKYFEEMATIVKEIVE